MSQPLLEQMSHALAHPRALPALLRTLHQRAPATSATLLSLLVSWLATKAWHDFVLYRSLGTGGLAPGGVAGWLIHTFILRPLAMARGQEYAADALPLPDKELQARGPATLAALSARDSRPMTFGLMPHRQLEAGNKEGTPEYEAILAHLNHLSERNPALKRSFSVLEAHTAPSLQVSHDSGSEATALSQLFLSGLHAPRRDAASKQREFAHLHAHDGSLHVVLAPQDAALLLSRRWGELHRLAGAAYRGAWWPPSWLPVSAATRWGYLSGQARARKTAKILPPTYCLVYAPRSQQEVESVKLVLNAAATFALGRAPQL